MAITSSVWRNYTLANVNSTNNKFYYGNEEIVIPEESYKLRDIERYLKCENLRSHNEKDKEDKEFSLVFSSTTIW